MAGNGSLAGGTKCGAAVLGICLAGRAGPGPPCPGQSGAVVAGKRVLDFAAGGGIAAIACAIAGAARVEAAEIDPMALAAIGLNAAANSIEVVPVGDVVGASCRWDLILCGDVCYEAPMTATSCHG